MISLDILRNVLCIKQSIYSIIKKKKILRGHLQENLVFDELFEFQ